MFYVMIMVLNVCFYIEHYFDVYVINVSKWVVFKVRAVRLYGDRPDGPGCVEMHIFSKYLTARRSSSRMFHLI